MCVFLLARVGGVSVYTTNDTVTGMSRNEV